MILNNIDKDHVVHPKKKRKVNNSNSIPIEAEEEIVIAKNTEITLVELQDFCKRDPDGYKEEFLFQRDHFLVLLQLAHKDPTTLDIGFNSTTTFLCHLVDKYEEELKELPNWLIELLESNGENMNVETRRILLSGLLLCVSKGVIDLEGLLPTLFKLYRIQDKHLRSNIFSYIVNDIQKINAPSIKKNKKKKKKITSNVDKHRLNSRIQNYIFSTFDSDPNGLGAQLALQIIMELYKKGVWTDSKTVNEVVKAFFLNNSKLLRLSLAFFLDADLENFGLSKDGELEKSEKKKIKGETGRLSKSAIAMRQAESTYSLKQKRIERRKHARKTKQLLKKNTTFDSIDFEEDISVKQSKKSNVNFPALHLVHDPQGFSEKLLKLVTTTSEPFEVRIRIMNLISRLISVHELILLSFYSFIERYVNPHQLEVTRILTIIVQSIHHLVPPDAIEPLLYAVSNKFVADHCTEAVITVGLNTIREICVRQPLVMNEVLLSDLIEYKSYKNKGVSMASRSILALFRELNPSLLHKRQRGKKVSTSKTPVQQPIFGDMYVSEAVDGVEFPRQAFSENENSDSDEILSDSADDSADDNDNDEKKITTDEFDNETVIEENNQSEELSLKPIFRGNLKGGLFDRKVNPKELHMYVTSERKDLHGRLESVLEGRADRLKYGSKKGNFLESGSLKSITNKAKSKKKLLSMVGHKNRRRLRDVAYLTNGQKRTAKKRQKGHKRR